MDQLMRVEDWPAEELKAAIIDPGELGPERAQAVRRFIRRIGGVENALLAIDMLVELEDAWSSSSA